MPPAKLKPSDIAGEAKRIYIPYIERQCTQWPVPSYSFPDSSKIRISPAGASGRKLRVAVIDGDPIDVALDWYDFNLREDKTPFTRTCRVESGPIAVVNMANEKRAGGDWESGLLAPEECLCRRSNLVHTLTTSATRTSHYPIPTNGGIYSPHVVVFRSGADKGYKVWKEFKDLPVVSVAPVRRPKLDESEKEYSFEQERELMKEKMRTVLRIAASMNHSQLCMGAFGVGPGFRNPPAQVAAMWRSILFSEREFQGAFSNVVFAIESSGGGCPKSGLTDFEVFKAEFDPANIVKTSWRTQDVSHLDM